MMRVFIDSGATKTEFLLVDSQGDTTQFQLEGINANYTSKKQIERIMKQFAATIGGEKGETIEQIIYYGAGCMPINKQEKIKEIIQPLFPTATVAVHSDLLGACHATCGDQPGYVAILGTGSAACYYDSEQITNLAPSLGYLLGDEGGGIYLGKLFLQYYLKGVLSDSLKERFESEFEVDRARVLHLLYRDIEPEKWMATIPLFLKKEIANPEVQQIVTLNFTHFFEEQQRYFKTESIAWHVVGSLGFHFQEQLKQAAQNLNMQIVQVIAQPVHQIMLNFAHHG